MPRGTSSETGRCKLRVDRSSPNDTLTELPFFVRGATVACMSRGAAADRLKRIFRIAVMALAALSGMMTPPALAQRQSPQRIVAVGDLHGDFQAWQAIALNAGIID